MSQLAGMTFLFRQDPGMAPESIKCRASIRHLAQRAEKIDHSTFHCPSFCFRVTVVSGSFRNNPNSAQVIQIVQTQLGRVERGEAVD